ncbi:hypothetical protein [Mesorhizobium sp. ES1-1]|uniref:hypothetical protein n=1 Tax=Mesorhizobium sp. ES1-1 TaxID=2876629 RepID=UPI001CCBEF67|nr:hypothetical protein [Mesorhizobium sp. ES1-1]MBZ9674566.1 hypothetical protein [Mesorhizobium sp. ES1-1]
MMPDNLKDLITAGTAIVGSVIAVISATIAIRKFSLDTKESVNTAVAAIVPTDAIFASAAGFDNKRAHYRGRFFVETGKVAISHANFIFSNPLVVWPAFVEEKNPPISIVAGEGIYFSPADPEAFNERVDKGRSLKIVVVMMDGSKVESSDFNLEG